MTRSLTRYANVAGTTARFLSRDTSSILFVAQLFGAATAFVVNILAARTLEPAGRGELALLLQIAYLSSLGLLLGCDRSVVAVYSGRPVRTVTVAFLRLLARPSLIGVLCAAAVVALPVPGLESWRVRLGLAFAFMVVNAFAKAVRSIAIAADRQRDYFAYSLTGEVLLLLTIGLLFVADVKHSATWVLAYVLAGTVVTIGWLARWLRRVPSNEVGAPASDDSLATARREGWQLFPATVAHNGTLRFDRLLLAGLASTTALGMYATVATMTELIAWPLLALADARLGRWREAHDEGTLRVGRILAAAAAYGLGMSLLVGAAISLLLVPLLGPEYLPARQLVVPLVLAAAVFGIAQILVNLLTAVRHNKLASTTEMIGLGATLVLYVVLIERYEAVGAAYGSLLGYSVGMLLAGVLLWRVRVRRAA